MSLNVGELEHPAATEAGPHVPADRSGAVTGSLPSTTYGEKFRQAAIATGGMPVSAGARGYHIQTEFRFDLSRVPATDRPALIGAIQQLIGEYESRAGESGGA